MFTCYSTALLWFSLQLETGVNVLFQIFILYFYFYLLHYVDSINISVLNLIIVIYTLLLCCFTPDSQNRDAYIIWYRSEALNITVCSRQCSAVNKKKIIRHEEKAHVYVHCAALLVLMLYYCVVIPIYVTFQAHRKLILLLIIYLHIFCTCRSWRKKKLLVNISKVNFPQKN